MQAAEQHLLLKSSFSGAACARSYVFDYTREVGDFYAAFPSLQSEVIFLETSTRQLIQPDALRRQKFDTAMGRNDQCLRHYFNRSAKIGACTAVQTGYQEDGRYILINQNKERDNIPRRLGHLASIDLENLFKLDHEIGHQICKNGYVKKDGNLCEAAADAYAALRHIQRFGGVTPYLENLVAFRALELVFRDDKGVHFTSAVVARIIQDSKEKDFTTLSPAETVRLADAYAAARPLGGQAIALVAAEFNAFKERFPEVAAGHMDVLRDLGACLLTTKSPMALKWGALAMQAILDGKALCQGVRVMPKGEEWMVLRENLHKRQAELRLTGAAKSVILS